MPLLDTSGIVAGWGWRLVMVGQSKIGTWVASTLVGLNRWNTQVPRQALSSNGKRHSTALSAVLDRLHQRPFNVDLHPQ